MDFFKIHILKDDRSFSPFYFYDIFLEELAFAYKKSKYVNFFLFNFDDVKTPRNYYIDPISIPLLLSLFEHLRDFQGESLNLIIANNQSTNKIIGFLDRADFFNIAGNNRNPNFPLGRELLRFDKNFIGGFYHKEQRIEHRVRGYIREEIALGDKLNWENTENIELRNYLVEHFSYKVKEHFAPLLYNNNISPVDVTNYIGILAELITNGVLHSNKPVYALMFTDSYKTKFSISDNGIGLFNSISSKEDNFWYKKFELSSLIRKDGVYLRKQYIKDSLLSIFETLYYSMLKDRVGLFDLLCKVVIEGRGYFRLHNEDCQIVISHRMIGVLDELFELRKSIRIVHSQFIYKKTSMEIYELEIAKKALMARDLIKKFFIETINKVSDDIRFSSIRMFKVKLKGVHIEVELPILSSIDDSF